jgi:hypothetical protein
MTPSCRPADDIPALNWTGRLRHTALPHLRLDVDRSQAAVQALLYACDEDPSMAELERHVRLYGNGRNPALRIPWESDFSVRGHPSECCKVSL